MSSVINETLLAIKSAFEAGVNIFNGGTAVSSSNPLPVQNSNGTPIDRSSSITTGGAGSSCYGSTSNSQSLLLSKHF